MIFSFVLLGPANHGRLPILKERVGVDWELEPSQISAGSEARKPIWIASDPDRRFYGTSPSEIVSRFMASRPNAGE